MSASAQRKLQDAHDRLQRGDIAAAASLCEEVLVRAPRNPDALWLLGTARLSEGRTHDALPVLERAVKAAPAHGPALESLGLAYLLVAQYADAERLLRRAAAVPGAPASVHMRLGFALLNQGRHAAATVELEGVVAREPGNLDAREQLAAVHLAVGRYVQAIDELREIVRARPADEEAILALANACFQTGALEEAHEHAAHALELAPDAAEGYGILAQIHYVRGEIDQAARVAERGFERTAARPLLGLSMHLLHRMCAWERWRTAWQRMAPQIATAADLGSPFSLLCEATTPEQQLSYTKRWAAARFEKAQLGSAGYARPASTIQPAPTGDGRPAPPPAIRRRGSPRLRIGYLSSDFQEHAAAYLLAEMLELHDRSRFEIFAYSYGPDDASPMRARVRDAVEHFVDIAWEADDAAVERIRADEIDVLVDLKGYTVGDRLQIMAQRPSPVQVTWLGYPGTTGAPFIDYLIADPYIVPPGAEGSYSERVLRMPHCYQPNDRRRPIAEPMTRAEYGLPQEGFVFCCFNQTVKIMPELFARWMRLLRDVPGSVLWIAEDNRWANAHLRAAAAGHGVAPERIVFGARVAFARHLARFRVADLALDTFPYTSHTTASDGLWMGCPLVGLCGDTFAARVSGSILTSCGLADLVTHTLDDYEKLALRLATDSGFMQDVRSRLAAARDAAPLFDAEKFARDLEGLYLRIADRPSAGQA